MFPQTWEDPDISNSELGGVAVRLPGHLVACQPMHAACLEDHAWQSRTMHMMCPM